MPSLATLHDEYALRGRIDEAAPVTNTSSVLIDASPDRVWDVLAACAAGRRGRPASSSALWTPWNRAGSSAGPRTAPCPLRFAAWSTRAAN